MLGALDDAQWAQVEASARPFEAASKEVLFRQGDPARRFFWLASGLVQLSRTSPNGREQIVEVIRAGQLFAEALMFMDDAPDYPVDGTCVQASRVVAFDNAVTRGLIGESPELALRMLSLMARRMHRLVATIDDLTLHSAVERVSGYLLEASGGRAVFTLDLPKRVLAARLALSPESLSRALSELRARGLVDVQRTSVHVLDRTQLAALVAGA